MNKEHKIATSMYRKIAIDIAQSVADGKYVEGQKLFGRSVLASQYKVSPETIRKAVYILKDMGILDTEKGSGVEVISVSKAREFVNRYHEIESIHSAQSDIAHWAQKQTQEIADVIQKIQFIVDTAERFKNSSPLTPFEITITKESTVIGKSADELRFWHNTGGTIIAIKRNNDLIVSPGPYATFREGDIFYVIGNDQTYAAIKKLLFE
ncbi:MAG: GntR family transcriptional regulator [Epulopiscium sp.]|nr:GntR family transcriptional regulator [Candidatus Epulonipiscium sp.]